MSPNATDPMAAMMPIVVETMMPKNGEPALPEGWEMGVTDDGDVFFIDHVNQKTTWEDPREGNKTNLVAKFCDAWKQATPEERDAVIICLGGDEGESRNVRQRLSMLCSGPLPSGWEESTTADGEPFFIDHVNQKTSWVDPRLRFIYEMDEDLPAGWEEAIDANGFVYYIDHISKKTQREHPNESSYGSLARLLRYAAGNSSPRKAKLSFAESSSLAPSSSESSRFRHSARSTSVSGNGSMPVRASGLLRMFSAPAALLYGAATSSRMPKPALSEEEEYDHERGVVSVHSAEDGRANAEAAESGSCSSPDTARTDRFISRQCGAAVHYLISVMYTFFGYDSNRKDAKQTDPKRFY